MSVKNLDSKDKYEKFKLHKRAIIFFGLEGCTACISMKPVYYNLANKYKKYVYFGYVDVKKLSLDFNLVPIVIGFYKGTSISSVSGISRTNPEELKRLAKEVLLTH